jgi:cell wall-associated NlpC family hydrolase
MNVGKEIAFKDAQPGDLLIFASKPGGKKVDHVAILYEKSASGTIKGSELLHAVSIATKTSTIKGNPNKPGVKITELGKRADGNWKREYFMARFMCVRRVLSGD